MCNYVALSIFIATMLVSAGPLHAAEKSDARRAWEQQVGEKLLENPSFAFVEDDPALPRVLLIGDSISIGYTPGVRELLAGKANVHRIPMNGGDTNRGVTKIESWLGDGDWDVIHFNWGLHDIKRLKDGVMDVSAEQAVTPEEYRANLRALIERMRETGATLIWSDTTPVPEGAAGRVPGDEVLYNTIAGEVMKESGVQRHHLHGSIERHLDTQQRPANVHFLANGSKLLAEAVAAVIDNALPPVAP